jgi:hypothetical protein
VLKFENGFINVNNGDIHIEIPLAVHQQRGRLNLNERLVYDSRIWKINLNPNTGGYWWQPTNVPGSMGGWSFYSGIESGSVGYSTRPSSAGCLPYTVNWYFNWTDPQGTTHSFPGVQTLKYNYVPPNCNPLTTGVNQTANSSGYASDGSGYLATVTNYTDVVITDKEGNQFSPAVIESNPSPTTPEVTDSNGNFWSQDSNGNLIDTLGRTPVKVSQSGNQTYYDVLGFNGVLNRYTVTTETVNYSTSFSQSAVTDVSGSFTAIQSISLPDGSSYSFTYDPGSYGELTSVTTAKWRRHSIYLHELSRLVPKYESMGPHASQGWWNDHVCSFNHIELYRERRLSGKDDCYRPLAKRHRVYVYSG